ncbi:MAG: hypothetical protein HQL37_15970, partial [Alphaproteobacteria bacterium]|nr:hypothetical protein [Alphaproteobacteria bacterium]
MKHISLAVFAAILIGGSFVAVAEEPKPATKPIPASFDWSACKSDLEKFCKGSEGNENIYLCLLKHDEDLSKACDASHTKYE